MNAYVATTVFSTVCAAFLCDFDRLPVAPTRLQVDLKRSGPDGRASNSPPYGNVPTACHFTVLAPPDNR